jgi:hypothetical protein
MRQHRRVLIALVVVPVLAGAPAAAQRRAQPSDAEIVGRAGLAASTDHVEVFQEGVTIDPAFAQMAEEAYRRLETLTGRRLDTATLGPKVRIYVSDAVVVSHVWRGYAHPQDPKGIVLLNGRVYQAALRGVDATYVHEMAHLFAWRYRSHTLREGLADYLALQIHPGAGIGPNPDGYPTSGRIPAQVVEHLGTTRPAPGWPRTSRTGAGTTTRATAS